MPRNLGEKRVLPELGIAGRAEAIEKPGIRKAVPGWKRAPGIADPDQEIHSGKGDSALAARPGFDEQGPPGVELRPAAQRPIDVGGSERKGLESGVGHAPNRAGPGPEPRHRQGVQAGPEAEFGDPEAVADALRQVIAPDEDMRAFRQPVVTREIPVAKPRGDRRALVAPDHFGALRVPAIHDLLVQQSSSGGKAGSMRGQQHPDVLIVGAGIFGLCCAWACAGRGLRVMVLERGRPGAGASGGPLGAMSPHQPANWSPKKAFQLEALVSAESHWREVAAAGGRDPGYARIGRLIPLPDATARRRAEAQAQAASRHWGGTRGWTLHTRTPDETWIAAEASAHGVAFEPLSARIHPRHAVDALVAAATARGVTVLPDTAVFGFEDGAVQTTAGRIAADRVVLAAGIGGHDLIRAATGVAAGRGVKGQAAVVVPRDPVARPTIFAEGIYVVPHADGTVGVGSTSENTWHGATATDGLLDDLLERAAALCPRLAGAALVERWAGLRPRARRPDPMIGPLPGLERVLVATGAYKIGFGIAHAVGAAIADIVIGTDPMLPEGFSPLDHGLRQEDVASSIYRGAGPT